LTYRELTRKLRRLGCELKRQSRGSHEIWQHPERNLSAVIPRHSGDIPTGTLAAILRGLGITRAELDSA
jgi:predicted RNA binding protein YcfA (HicA-like mRNA interferase family)